MNDPKTIEAEIVTPAGQTQAVAVREPGGAVATTGQQESFESLMALAKELCSTGFLPQAVKTPAQAVAIILTGRELGLGPMQALRSICIIQGKPELAADLQLSIFHRDGGRSKWLALVDSKAVLWLRHPNGDEHTETFTIEDARRAGLAGGQNWHKYPKAMLRSRAITAGLKSIGFEPLSGTYSPGEIGGPEIVGAEPETVPETSPTAPKRAETQRPAQSSAQAPKAAPTRQAASAPAPGDQEQQRRADNIIKLEKLAGKPFFPELVRYFQECPAPSGKFYLMPNEGLESLPAPVTAALISKWDSSLPKIEEWLKANPKPAQGPLAKPIEVPRDANPDPNSPDAPWRAFPVPFGKHAGTKLADLDKKVLFGFWANFVVETEFNRKPKRTETVARDQTFRVYLDEAGKHYEFKAPEDSPKAEESEQNDEGDVPF